MLNRIRARWQVYQSLLDTKKNGKGSSIKSWLDSNLISIIIGSIRFSQDLIMTSLRWSKPKVPKPNPRLTWSYPDLDDALIYICLNPEPKIKNQNAVRINRPNIVLVPLRAQHSLSDLIIWIMINCCLTKSQHAILIINHDSNWIWRTQALVGYRTLIGIRSLAWWKPVTIMKLSDLDLHLML